MENKILTLDKVWKNYAKSYFHITPKMQRELLNRTANDIGTGDIFDAGCGVGKLLFYLKNFNSYTGIDSNEEMLKIAIEENKNKQNVSFKREDICDLSLSDSKFDSVTSINVLYSVADHLSMLKKNYNLLKEDGTFVIASPNRSLDIGFLESKIINEFKDKTNKNELLSVFIESNKHLAGIAQSEGYKPTLFNEKEICNILEDVGFSIKKKEDAYYNQLFYIMCKKN